MIKPFTASEQLMFSTVKISSTDSDGVITSTGTGFFYNYSLQDNKHLLLLVTNKHVIRDSFNECLRLRLRDNSSQDYLPSDISEDVWIASYYRKWFFHPDEQVDLAALLFTPIEYAYEQQTGRQIYTTKIGNDITMWGPGLEQMSTVSEVLMFGYPNGLSDEVNNLPLIRRGITSIHPYVNYMGQPWGVVDLACFPGSSGSPIFIFNERHLAKIHEPCDAGTALFIGVLFAGPQINAQGKVEIVEAPTASVVMSTTQMMMHLGYYVKAAEVVALGDYIRDCLLADGPILSREELNEIG